MVKPEKFGHLHLIYHFMVPLKGSLQAHVMGVGVKASKSFQYLSVSDLSKGLKIL